jgi:hypothetical protein
MGRREMVVAVLVLAWLGLAADSVLLALTSAPEGDGFTRGIDRVQAVLLRQIVGVAVAVAAWRIGRPLGPGWVKGLSLVPVGVTALMGLAVLGLMLKATLEG